MLDNMDGLSAGVAAIAAAMLAAVVLLVPESADTPAAIVRRRILVVFGRLVLGFLWHQSSPARLFMGDAGSYLIGYLLATISWGPRLPAIRCPNTPCSPRCACWPCRCTTPPA